MASGRQLKVSNFYGDKIARPYVLLDEAGKPVQDRVEAPQVNDALLAWATRVPVRMGGTMVKPQWDGPEAALKEARSDFQIFFQEQYDDVRAANPSLPATDRRSMLSAASVYWRERLTAEERAAYRERARAEKAAAAEAVAEAEQANPRFKAFREKMQKYKESMHNILTAAKVSSGPLWRAQRRLNAKYRLLEDQQAADAEEEAAEAAEDLLAGKARKAVPTKGRGRGKKGAAAKRLVESDSSSDEEDEEDEGGAAAEAAEAMEKLMLATAKKGSKPAPAGAKSAAASGKKAATRKKASQKEEEEEAVMSSSEEEEEEEESLEQQQARSERSTRSGAAVLAERAAAAVKGRRGYTGAFDLPPSQSATPAKGRAVPKKGGSGAVAAAAAVPAKSPGKRTRGTRAAAVAAEPAVEESPAKKARRSARTSK